MKKSEITSSIMIEFIQHRIDGYFSATDRKIYSKILRVISKYGNYDIYQEDFASKYYKK